MNRTRMLTLATLLTISIALPAIHGAESPWEGLWAAERTFGTPLQGKLVLQRIDETQSSATIQSERTAATRTVRTDGSVLWSLEFLAQAWFRGVQTQPGAKIVGHWTQSAGAVEVYPVATPVTLHAAGPGTWVGEVRPMIQQVQLYFPLEPNDDGNYRTFLRNPERNLGVYFRVETVQAAGDELRFLNRDGEAIATADAITTGERFTLRFPRFDEAIDFTRRTREQAPGFYPRRRPAAGERLLQPADLGDGWGTVSVEQAGFDGKKLVSLVREIEAGVPETLRSPYLHAMLVAHRGKLVVEEYFHGHGPDQPHDSRSAGKSLAATLVGIAVRQGALKPETPVYPLFGGVDAFENPDARKREMTIEHLLTMSAGFDCDDNDEETPGNEDVMQSQQEQPDWYRYMLDLPMVRKPGEQGVYCSGGINLLGGAVARATGESLPEFFRTHYAEPLGIDYYQMNLDPLRRGYMGGGIRFRPRDFLKLGQLYLNGGVWNGRRLLDENWVKAAAAPHASINEEDDYGYGWWRIRYDVQGRQIDAFYASGNGGQLVIVVPELELATLFHAGNYGDYRTWSGFRDRYMTEFILPAALQTEGSGPAPPEASRP